jgi:ribosomal protein L18E
MDNRNINGGFIGGSKFNTTLRKNNRNFTTVALGTSAQINKDISAFINYENANSADENRSEIRGGIRVMF